MPSVGVIIVELLAYPILDETGHTDTVPVNCLYLELKSVHNTGNLPIHGTPYLNCTATRSNWSTDKLKNASSKSLASLQTRILTKVFGGSASSLVLVLYRQIINFAHNGIGTEQLDKYDGPDHQRGLLQVTRYICRIWQSTNHNTAFSFSI